MRLNNALNNASYRSVTPPTRRVIDSCQLSSGAAAEPAVTSLEAYGAWRHRIITHSNTPCAVARRVLRSNSHVCLDSLSFADWQTFSLHPAGRCFCRFLVSEIRYFVFVERPKMLDTRNCLELRLIHFDLICCYSLVFATVPLNCQESFIFG